ncbi:MAG: FimB/Mfa2 family fimbrial subunit [Bacteroidia bacterium]|nr:FimB/Mfa2 family fimbrial subunit [Bacteroidia bacterium]
MLSDFKVKLRTLLSSALVCIAASACGELIYDDPEDCPEYRVKFRYDWNMKYADAFAHEVKAVTLYVLDPQGSIVWSASESGEALAAGDYSMVVKVPAGKYDLLAWCDADEFGTYSFGEGKLKTDLTCSLNSKSAGDAPAYVDTDLDRLYYGYLSAADFSAKKGKVTVALGLKKNTNSFKVVLQHLSGAPVDCDKFDFSISADNALMDWDNSLLPSADIEYRAWSVYSGYIDLGTRAEALNVAIAELSTGRLVKGHSPRLNIRLKASGETVLSVPLIDYALLVKGRYNEGLDDQEYLDRQDEYDMVFFLDEADRWVDSFIYINSWKVVLQHTEL